MRKHNLTFLSRTGFAAFTAACVLGLALYPLTPAHAEDTADSRSAGHTAVLYDNSNGLPTAEANAIAQTRDGFIWIGSYGGLVRYDGNSFFRYDASLGISSVVSLFVDSKDRLWIGTNDSGVAVYDKGEFTSYKKDAALRSASIRSIAEDPSGNILIATTHGISYIDADMELHLFDAPQLNEEYINELHAGSDGVLYGETQNGAFFSIEDMRVSAFFNGKDLGLSGVNCIFPSLTDNGYVYLGTEDGRVIYGDMRDGMKNYKVFPVRPLTNINAIRIFDDGLVWLCADNGAGYLNGFYRCQPLENIPMNNSIDDMIVDYEGNQWFVSSRQGVMKIAENRFTDLNLLSGLPSAVVNSTCVRDGLLYIGSDNGLYILRLADYAPVENELTELLAGIRIRSIKKDSRDNLWFCTYSENGLVCCKKDGTITTFGETDGLPSSRVRTCLELSDGRLAVSVSGAVVIMKNGAIDEVYNNASGISNTEILSIEEGADGKLYLGSDGDGLYIVEGNKISRLGLNDGLESEVILRVKKDTEDNAFWMVTSNSLAYMKDESIQTLTQFPYSNNFDIFFDSAEHVWVLSSNGIYVVARQELLSNAENMEYTFFDFECGIPVVTTANSRSCLTDDGTLYISGTTGVASVNLNEVGKDDGDIRLTVPYIEMDGETRVLDNASEITVPAGVRRITIYGYALTYAFHNPKIGYYLEGFDTEPRVVSRMDMQPVSYTNLDSGRYTFHLSLINAMTGEEENEISVIINKQAAFYELWWVQLLAGLCFAAAVGFLVFLYFRKKTERLLRKQKEDQSFIDHIIRAFAKCIDMKDRITNGHSFRVAKYTALLADKMGYSKDAVHNIYNVGLLHDIGKISIPDGILFKTERLTDEEYAVMKSHTSNGSDILKGITLNVYDDRGRVSTTWNLGEGAGGHHERIDGKGYPEGLKDGEISELAQIIAVADTYDTMHSKRPYKEPMSLEAITAELKRVAGTQLSAPIVEIMLGLIKDGVISDDERTSTEALQSIISTS